MIGTGAYYYKTVFENENYKTVFENENTKLFLKMKTQNCF